MKTVWSAKVHTSGTKIQLLKNGSVTKVIKASDDTFSSDNAQFFAKNLVAKLNSKIAKQMTDPGAKPSVTTKSEEQANSLKVLSKEPKGISPKEAYAILEENKNLKRKVAKLEKDAAIERKARRGLAIAKSMVEQKKIANDEKAIKDQVMKIVAMSNEEIGLLERKVAGIPLYDSIEEAQRASRRYARMSRLHKQAAEDAQLAGDDNLADAEDIKAARYDELAKEAACFCSAVQEAAKEQATGVDPQGKKTASEEVAKEVSEEKVADDDSDEDDIDNDEVDDDDLDDEEEQLIEEDIDGEDFDVTAAAAIYRKIAADHRAKAESLRKKGNEKEAAVEDEIADESEALASNVEASVSLEEEAADETIAKQAASIYRKIASDHRKKADEYEAAGDSEKADEEDEIADEAEQMAALVEGYSKTGETEEEMPEEVAEEKEAAAEESAETPVETPEVEEKEAAKEEDAEINSTEEETDMDKDAGKDEDDPLAALMTETEKEAGEEEEEIELGDMPSDELITAALADEDSNEDEKEAAVSEEVVEGDDTEEEDKEAADDTKTKTANEGYNRKSASANRFEQNPVALDPQVREIEDMLWR